MRGLGSFHSATIASVARPRALRGSWFGAAFSPRVTINRMCTPSVHAVRLERASDLAHERGPIEPDVEPDFAGAPVEAIEMLVEEQQHASVQAQPFPHAIAHDEAAIEDGDFRVLPSHERTVQVDEGVGVARIGLEILAARHGLFTPVI